MYPSSAGPYSGRCDGIRANLETLHAPWPCDGRTAGVRFQSEVWPVSAPDRPPFERVLIANRGEIAVRVIGACAELGIRSIAVYSEADRGALHTRLADEAVAIGPAPAGESYLSSERIVEAARASGAQAIHPGYGFLAENAAFAEACAAAGLTFVGPGPEAMRLLGDKAAARRLAAAEGVPTVPGYDGPDQDDATLAREAQRIGVPLMVKAASGGGGRGMREVTTLADLPEALAAARREASAAFGDDTLILERLVTGARHVEVQVLGDSFGSLIHLGERDCSVQRRHQKVVEESPGPVVSPELRAALGAAALRVSRAAGYTNAGTCEFLLDSDGQFWFIEMNARLQVEHPVTELVTGFDLVRAQFEIAAGWPLRWRQEDVRLQGHAVECRLYAEDPVRQDQPSPGRITRIRPPLGPGLRHDLGYADGDVVPPFYDTMFGKMIAYGEDRASAIRRARAAIDSYVVEGIPTNRPLLAWILDHPTFRDGQAATGFLGEARPETEAAPATPPEAMAAAVAYDLAAPAESDDGTGRASLGDWRIAGQGIVTFWQAGPDAAPAAIGADRMGPTSWQIGVLGRRCVVEIADIGAGLVLVREAGPGDGVAPPPTRCRVTRLSDALTVETDGSVHRVRRAAPPDTSAGPARSGAGGLSLPQAPLPGRVVRIAVAAGDAIRERETLVVVEAMKIETAIVAPRDGIVAAVLCAVGEAVAGGQVLVELAPR
jgi:3-methylcrotonyl-CoA carboxylase alpha subunit